MGLKHILERRTQQYGEEKAINFIHDIPKMIDEAKVYEELADRFILKTPKATLILGKKDNNTFVLSGYYESKNKKLFMETSSLGYEANFTGKSVSEHYKNDDILLPNHSDNTTTLKVNETPKSTKEIIKEAKKQGKSVKETKELIKQNQKQTQDNLNNANLEKDFNNPNLDKNPNNTNLEKDSNTNPNITPNDNKPSIEEEAFKKNYPDIYKDVIREYQKVKERNPSKEEIIFDYYNEIKRQAESKILDIYDYFNIPILENNKVSDKYLQVKNDNNLLISMLRNYYTSDNNFKFFQFADRDIKDPSKIFWENKEVDQSDLARIRRDIEKS